MASREFRPAPTVMAFMLSQAFVRLIRGPVGSGKSTGSLYEIARQAKLQKQGPDGVRRTRWAVIRNTRQQLMDTTFKSFIQLFPDGVAGRWRAMDMTFILKFDDVHAEVMFRPLDTPDDVRRLLSLELTGAFVNEARELDEEIFNALKGRVGRFPSVIEGGCSHPCLFMDTNPPDEDTWLHELEMDPPENTEVFVQPPAFKPGTREVNPFAENLENLPAGYYENMAQGASDEFVKVYIRNEFGTTKLGQPVWGMFNPDYHIAKQIIVPDTSLKLVIGADAGLTPAAAFVQFDMHGRMLVLDDPAEFDMGTQRFIRDRLKPLIRAKYHNCDTIICGDPAMKGRQQGDEKQVADFYKDAGFSIVTPKSNALLPRIEGVESYLSRLTEVGPAFQISPNCKHLIRAMKGGYRYPIKKSNGEAGMTPEKNKWSHSAEALQYGGLYALEGRYTKANQVSTRQRAKQPPRDLYSRRT
jgi:hypothetical protein